MPCPCTDKGLVFDGGWLNVVINDAHSKRGKMPRGFIDPGIRESSWERKETAATEGAGEQKEASFYRREVSLVAMLLEMMADGSKKKKRQRSFSPDDPFGPGSAVVSYPREWRAAMIRERGGPLYLSQCVSPRQVLFVLDASKTSPSAVAWRSSRESQSSY